MDNTISIQSEEPKCPDCGSPITHRDMLNPRVAIIRYACETRPCRTIAKMNKVVEAASKLSDVFAELVEARSQTSLPSLDFEGTYLGDLRSALEEYRKEV